MDLGAGHGLIARSLAASFSQVIGTDPSSGMVQQARSSTPNAEYPNVSYREAVAESMPFLDDQSVDMIVSGQAAHWFDPAPFSLEMKRVVRRGGTLALWCYKDHVFVDSPNATQVLNEYAYGDDGNLLGPYWQQPGRSRVQNLLRDLQPPETEWADVQRVEYEPGSYGPRSGEGTMFLSRTMTLHDCMNYIRTWSSFHGWQEKHPESIRREDGGDGDVIDEMLDEMVRSEPKWQGDPKIKGKEVVIEWGTGLLLARRR